MNLSNCDQRNHTDVFIKYHTMCDKVSINY